MSVALSASVAETTPLVGVSSLVATKAGLARERSLTERTLKTTLPTLKPP